ncbi:hypothetical protein SNOG_10107 [Parastagonospora nodorum SN15]|uniref:Heterokaryon incompatibility domain-containing protein n=1 Tax=Phaeosphaeria nodorum (strain SN15 / ATCC MYA-4574 / FGSC 10173) TaxID=321614 RepID=Q0UDQ7_PHANO|nr:hypothetical protein SNOG_10107 [Parastagonospora nodorum SN15]EAT82442.2 hypothetical protein SNOG_10107 [Parastagonospora nodorum SN15]
MADIETNAPARPLPFVHSPLPDSETHIRLLEVLQGNFEHHVVCVMSAWPLDSAPPYSAISYTWGDPALTATITIDGRNMVVGQNCEYALQQTFAIEKKKKEKYVWVDAVCIDQNNIQERGHQVAIMGKVYSKAAQVFAYYMQKEEELVGRYSVGCPLVPMGRMVLSSTSWSLAWNEMPSQYEHVNQNQAKKGFGSFPQETLL